MTVLGKCGGDSGVRPVVYSLLRVCPIIPSYCDWLREYLPGTRVPFRRIER